MLLNSYVTIPFAPHPLCRSLCNHKFFNNFLSRLYLILVLIYPGLAFLYKLQCQIPPPPQQGPNLIGYVCVFHIFYVPDLLLDDGRSFLLSNSGTLLFCHNTIILVVFHFTLPPMFKTMFETIRWLQFIPLKCLVMQIQLFQFVLGTNASHDDKKTKQKRIYLQQFQHQYFLIKIIYL